MSKKIKGNESKTPQGNQNTEIENYSEKNTIFTNDTDSSNQEDNLRNLEDDNSNKRKQDFMNKGIKRFGFVVGLVVLLGLGYSMFSGSPNTNYQSDLTSGIIQNIEVGDRLSEEAVALQPTDVEIDLTLQDGGPIKLYLWDFDSEDGDYVQVFVNGMAHTEPFMVKHKEVKISVPSKGVIQVKGIRDGDGEGISYGVFFNKTGEKYLNTVPLNAVNTYTLKTTN